MQGLENSPVSLSPRFLLIYMHCEDPMNRSLACDTSNLIAMHTASTVLLYPRFMACRPE